MDDFYNYEAAKLSLEKYTLERCSDKRQKKWQLCEWEDGVLNSAYPHTLPNIRTTKLVAKINRGAPEEVLLRVQGVLCGKDLPPLKSAPAEKIIKHLRQTVSLTGLGLGLFDSAITHVYAAQTSMERELPEGVVDAWKPSTFQRCQAIDVGNRYFSTIRYANDAPVASFDPDVDPHGWLKNCTKGEFVHTEENRVEYYRFAKDGPVKASPTVFRIGDIVEVTLSLVITPVSAVKYKMMPILRSVALVDSTETSMAIIRRNTTCVRTSMPKAIAAPKRRRAYENPAEDTSDEDDSIDQRTKKIKPSVDDGHSNIAGAVERMSINAASRPENMISGNDSDEINDDGTKKLES